MEIGARRTENGARSTKHGEQRTESQRAENGEQRAREQRKEYNEHRAYSTVNRTVPGFFGKMLRSVNFMKDIDVIC